jgi:uncharacterized Rmd1/YagE family protein
MSATPLLQLFGERRTVLARALYLGERIDVRSLEATESLATLPLLIPAGEHGYMALFRYGVVVLFNVQPLEEATQLKHLESFVQQAFERPESETLEMRLTNSGEKSGEKTGDASTDRREDFVQNGAVLFSNYTVERLQIIADILAKSVVLAHYESSIASAFDAIEPFAKALKGHKTPSDKAGTLMQYVGDTLLIQHKMVGRVEVTEKPELLWDTPELGRLFARLEDEFELVERHNGIERKLMLIARTVETELDILQNQRTLRMEWYVVLLIAMEILLSVYEIFVVKH